MIRNFGALRHENFRTFFYGQSLALIGTWVQSTAMSWLVYRLSGSAFLLGLTGFAAQIPMLLVSPFAGVLADRFDRRTVLISMQVVLLVHGLILAVFAWLELLAAWHVVIAAFVMGSAMALETSARQSFVPVLIDDRADLPSALAFGAFMQNSGRMIGPTLAGFIIHIASEAGCFLASAVSKIAVLVSLLRIDAPRNPRSERVRSVAAELAEAYRYQRSIMPLRVLLKHIALISMVATPYAVMLPIYAAEVFGGGAATLGLLLGAAGMGGVCGGLALAWRNNVVGMVQLNQRASLACGLALLGFAYCREFWISMVLLFVVGVGIIVIVTSTTTVTQMIVDEDKRARVMAFFTMSFLGVTPIGALLAGILADAIGVEPVIAAGGFCSVLAALGLGRRMPEFREHLRPIYVRLGLIDPN
ncbi:MAG: MFS transporter [Proteobacteria bacterium]|nr:MFS transporter [Burkholderiales bacterium]